MNNKKAFLVALLLFIVLCIGCLGIFLLLGYSSDSLSKDNPFKSIEKQENTVIPPTPTPLPRLGLDLNQFIAKYDSLTDIQKENFITESTGKWVLWSGKIIDVEENSTISVHIPNTLASTIYLKGVPDEEAIQLNKGQTIQFVGKIDSVKEFLGLNITLVEVRLQ